MSAFLVPQTRLVCVSGNLALLGHQRIPSRYREAGMKEWSWQGQVRWKGKYEGDSGNERVGAEVRTAGDWAMAQLE